MLKEVTLILHLFSVWISTYTIPISSASLMYENTFPQIFAYSAFYYVYYLGLGIL